MSKGAVSVLFCLQGLEDQLLGEVVRQERPELEDQRDRLVTSIAADKRQLQDLEVRRACSKLPDWQVYLQVKEP